LTGPISLAVIVIARNEEKTIHDSLASCLEAVSLARNSGLLERGEVVLVDSASADRTREISSHLPVRIIAIPPTWPLSSAAGRFVGLRSTDSNYVLFVDGDFVLNPPWLCSAIRAFDSPSIAAVCGVDQESLKGESAISRYVDELSRRMVPDADLVDTQAIPVGLYRRDWIERAGGIQPFLKGAEDRDLALRIRMKGGRLLKTREVMGTHYWSPGADLDLVEYLRSVAHWSYGEGQAARLANDDPRIREAYVKRYANARQLAQLLLGFAGLGWGCTVGLAIALGSPPLLILCLGGGIGAVVATAMGRRESITESIFRLHQVPYVLVRQGGFLLGLINRPRPATDYPRAGIDTPRSPAR